MLQGQRTAAKVIRRDDSHPHFRRSSCPLWSHCWHHPFFSSWAISGWISEKPKHKQSAFAWCSLPGGSSYICFITEEWRWAFLFIHYSVVVLGIYLRTCYEWESLLIKFHIVMWWQLYFSVIWDTCNFGAGLYFGAGSLFLWIFVRSACNMTRFY